LFSDNEDDNEDDVLSDDDKTEQWRHERFKRESYLSEVTIYSGRCLLDSLWDMTI